jgi:serine/threonine protein kinase
MDLNDNYEEDLVMEIAMMKTLTHPNIVKYIDSYIVKDKLWVCLPFVRHFLTGTGSDGIHGRRNFDRHFRSVSDSPDD